MTDLNIQIGERVREARKQAGLSLAAVALAIIPPITLQQLANYERGKHRWPVDTLCEVARIINIPVQDLIGHYDRSGHEPPHQKAGSVKEV